MQWGTDKFDVLGDLMGDVRYVKEGGKLPDHLVRELGLPDPSDPVLIQAFIEDLEGADIDADSLLDEVQDAYASWVNKALDKLVPDLDRYDTGDAVDRLAVYMTEELWFSIIGGVPEWGLLDDYIKPLHEAIEMSVDKAPAYADVYDAIWPAIQQYEVENDSSVAGAWDNLKSDMEFVRDGAKRTVAMVAKDVDKYRRVFDSELLSAMEDYESDLAGMSAQQSGAYMRRVLEEVEWESDALDTAWYGLEDFGVNISEYIEKRVTEMLIESDPRQEPLLFDASTRVAWDVPDATFPRSQDPESDWGDYPQGEYEAPDEEDLRSSIVIFDTRDGAYQAFAGNEYVGAGDDWDILFEIIRLWMENEHYFPEIYYVNERGNIALLDEMGAELQSWV